MIQNKAELRKYLEKKIPCNHRSIPYWQTSHISEDLIEIAWQGMEKGLSPLDAIIFCDEIEDII